MKKFIQILTVSSLILLSSLTLFAEDNDGKAKENPVCDSGYPNSFEGASYYDMAVPYALTIEDVGGYATTGGDKIMAKSTRKEFIGDHWNIDQAKYDGSANYLYKNTCSNISFSYDENGMSLATDKNGNEYYMLALPKYFFNNGGVEWGTSNRGVACELYFTDGKYIRVLIADAKAVGHTNGGEGEEHLGTNQDAGHYYKFSTLNYAQYQNIYQAYAGEVFEWFSGSGVSFSNVSEIVGSSGHVSYVRVYTNVNLYDSSPMLASGQSKEAIGEKKSSGGNIGSNTQSSENTITGYTGGFYSEMDLSAYVKLAELNIQAQYLDKATRDNLSQNDLENLASWEDNVTSNKKEYGFIAWMRIIIMWVGIIFTIYIFLIYLAYWFDKLNSIIDLDVLSILTFGRLHAAIDDKEANFSLGKKQDRMTVSHKDMLFICITGLIFGTLFITGTFYKVVAGFINFILRNIG